jgi:hypothetical protein
MKVINQIGSLMAIYGITAIVYGFMDRAPIILSWIYELGDTTAWIIKIALTVVGGVLWFISRQKLANVELASSENSEENNS